METGFISNHRKDDYMAQQIYYLHSCMSLLFIGTSQQKLKMKISKEIEEGNMEYYDGDLSQKEQAKKFRKDWKTETRATINSRLTYGDFDYTYNNEEM